METNKQKYDAFVEMVSRRGIILGVEFKLEELIQVFLEEGWVKIQSDCRGIVDDYINGEEIALRFPVTIIKSAVGEPLPIYESDVVFGFVTSRPYIATDEGLLAMEGRTSFEYPFDSILVLPAPDHAKARYGSVVLETDEVRNPVYGDWVKKNGNILRCKETDCAEPYSIVNLKPVVGAPIIITQAAAAELLAAIPKGSKKLTGKSSALLMVLERAAKGENTGEYSVFIL